ncbi:NYN domain-containing protein [Abortiporus biennis]|nr:NYN domain-containing protein [Abortiporus biennis]
MAHHEHVGVFWDYENCSPASTISGYSLVNNIRQIAHKFGRVTSFKAYADLSQVKNPTIRSELHRSAVSLTDCPHNGEKDVADHTMIVDMFAFALNNPSPATFIVITGDGDFVYAISTLRNLKYKVVIITPQTGHQCLKGVAGSEDTPTYDWDLDILRRTPRGSPYRGTPSTADRTLVSEYDNGKAPTTPITNSPIEPRARRRGNSFRDIAQAPMLRTPPVPPRPLMATTASSLQSPLQLSTNNVRHPARPSVDIPSWGSHSRLNVKTDGEDRTPCGTPSSAPAQLPKTNPLSPISSASNKSSNSTITSNSANSTNIVALNLMHQSQRECGGTEELLPESGNADGVNGCLMYPPEVSESPSAFQDGMLLQQVVVSTTAQAEDNDRTDDESASVKVGVVTPSDRTASLPDGLEDQLGGSPPFLSADSYLNVPPTDDHIPGMLQLDPCLLPLLTKLRDLSSNQQYQHLRSHVSLSLKNQYPDVYRDANVPKFKQYVELAVKAGLVELGGAEGTAWISLMPKWR